MTAEIICVGTELLLGDIVNTNAQFLSRELAELGISVLHQHVIGDNPDRLRELVAQAKSRSELLVFSGGLGPTQDDLTKETVARAFGDPLRFDEEEWQKILTFFARTNRTPTPNNRKQAMVPTHGRKLPNAHGTAPGAWFEADGCIAVLMPGVPREMKAMWAEQIRPVLLERQNCTIHSKTLRVLGGESSIASKVAGLFESDNPTAAIYCKTGESEIRVTARAATEAEAEAACDARIQQFRRILGPNAYDVDVPGLEYTVVHALQAKGLHAATAESCTGGLVAQMLTNVPGSSEVFGYGFVTYAEEAKSRLLGVDPALMERYNVVSGPVAVAMAYGALHASGADLAVGITGIAGPGGALPGKPVGTVYLAGADARSGKAWLQRLTLGGYRERSIIRTRAALYALDLLRLMALDLPVEEALAVPGPDTPPQTLAI
ncbi:competence/damage-inducible protein A [bacterium]|nr:competence/damage-inducible protein A [bacterium]